MKKTLIWALAALALMLAGCTGDALTTDNGAPKKAVAEAPGSSGQTCTCTKSAGTYCQIENGGATLHCEKFSGGCAQDNQCKMDVTGTKFSSCPSGQVWQGGSMSWTSTSSATFTCVATNQCVPSCSGNCRDNGCGGTCPNNCASDETCTQNGACVPNNAECWFAGGTLCYPNGGGLNITCQKFKPGCNASTTLSEDGSPFNDTCDDGNVNTQDSIAPSSSLTFTGWDYKSVVCVHTANGGGGGQQVPNSATCRVRPVSTGMAWLGVHGGGAASTSFADIKSAPWQSTPVAPSGTGGWASVSVESQPFAAVLPHIESSKWAFGAKEGYTLPQNNGDWQVQCDGLPTVTFTNSTKLCSPGYTLTVGDSCRWLQGSDYRFVVRLH